VKIITIHQFVDKHSLSIDFLKGDLEGHTAAIVAGATEGMVRDRFILSLSSYHDFSEMYNMSIFLLDLLPNYYFEWQMENIITIAFLEISSFGRPGSQKSADSRAPRLFCNMRTEVVLSIVRNSHSPKRKNVPFP
jgi:hypothetical protein